MDPHETTPRTILVSACLLGVNCRYNGQTKRNQSVIDYLDRTGLIAIPVCPEQLAGMPTPRPATRFRLGDGHDVLSGPGEVVSYNGEPMNEVFCRGAEEVLKIARASGCRTALFKERSPSCGVHQIDRNGERVTGVGVTTALLQREGIEVFSEEQIDIGD